MDNYDNNSHVEYAEAEKRETKHLPLYYSGSVTVSICSIY